MEALVGSGFTCLMDCVTSSRLYLIDNVALITVAITRCPSDVDLWHYSIHTVISPDTSSPAYMFFAIQGTQCMSHHRVNLWPCNTVLKYEQRDSKWQKQKPE